VRPGAPSAADIDVHPALPGTHALLPTDRLLWSPDQLRDLTRTVATDQSAVLREVLRFTTPQRWWLRLGLTAGVELWLLSWLPGQHTRPHDHGGASGSFTVLLGDVHEEFRYPRADIRSRVYTAGDAIGFGSGRAHQVRNRSLTPSATVHAYSPPLVPTRDYRSLADIPDDIPPLPAPSPFAKVLAETVEP
jgi:hypothetical protein